MARRDLWDVGLDYEHVTCLGIGSYQNRHTVPEAISQHMFITIGEGFVLNLFCSRIFNTDKFKHSLLTNPLECLGPGYYEENQYGVRVSDVLHVIDLPESGHFFEQRGAYQFDDITMVPIQAKMINTALLTYEEVR